jgi:hypothetical protein
MTKSEAQHKKFLTDINALIGFLIEQGMADDENLAIMNQDGPTTFTVGYPNPNFAATLKKIPYADVYVQQLTSRAYNVRMLDGALLQLVYEFVDKKIMRHRLSFLPSPNLLEFQNNADIYIEDVIFAEVIEKQVVTVPLRFDYDARPGVPKSLEHPVSHLTLGQYSNCRIPVEAPVTPSFFVEFILRSFYNTASLPIASLLPMRRYDLDRCITDAESSYVHIGVPFES